MQDGGVGQTAVAPSNSAHRRFYSAPDPRRYGRESQADAREEVRRALEMLPTSWSAPAILELGVGAGGLAGIHPGYIALEYSEFAIRRYLGPTRAICGDMQHLPIRGSSVACVVSIAALEHVPLPDLVLAEIDRVPCPGGIVYLAPAWFCRPRAARDLLGRTYKDLRWRDRMCKASIPLRESMMWRGLTVLLRRLLREMTYGICRRPLPFHYRRLSPNLEKYLTSDSDAFTSMDPHAALMYFISRGYAPLNTPSGVGRLLIRHAPLVLRKSSPGTQGDQ